MILATVLTLCTFATCNDYFVDVATPPESAEINLIAHNTSLRKVWNIKDNDRPLQDWLDRHNITEDARFLETYEFNTKEVTEDDIP